jgi:hypothetical protein
MTNKLSNGDAVRLGKRRWAGASKKQRAAVGAALAEARRAAGCYSSELQRARAVAGWATRRRKAKTPKNR